MRLKVRNITGREIKYRPITAAKPRGERKRSHIAEWKSDVVAYLDKRGGKILTRQRRFARELGMLYSTLKIVLNELEKEGAIYRDSV